MEVLREHGFSVIGSKEKRQVWKYYVIMVFCNVQEGKKAGLEVVKIKPGEILRYPHTYSCRIILEEICFVICGIFPADSNPYDAISIFSITAILQNH